MRALAILLVFCLGCGVSGCAVRPAPRLQSPPVSRADFLAHLHDISALENPVRRTAELDSLWAGLQAAGRIPFVAADSVTFLFRGQAGSVTFTGDFDGWNPEPPHARRITRTDLWILNEVFPGDARLDYKIVINGGTWLLDPANPRTQRGGFGDNSELRMPAYVPSPWVERQPDVPRGSLTAAALTSSNLGYTVQYTVYTPADYADLDSLPVIYVTDGQEYADPRLGSMVEVLDNLIAAHRLRPLLAVFIDPRVNGKNLRAEQDILNENFVGFVRDELVPVIDDHFRTGKGRMDRGILGTSLGGLNAAWFALRAGDTFGRIGIQSPAFQAGESRIIGLWEQSPPADVDIFLTWGTLHDFGEDTRKFCNMLNNKEISYRKLILNEGHSWGAWRAQLDDILTAFWPAP